MSHDADIDIPRTITSPYFNTNEHSTIKKILEWFTDNVVGSLLSLGELEDVTLAAEADNDVLAYDSATSEWVNADLPTLLNGQTLTNVTLEGSTIVGGYDLSMASVVVLAGADNSVAMADGYDGKFYNGQPGSSISVLTGNDAFFDGKTYTLAATGGGFALVHDGAGTTVNGFKLPGDVDLDVPVGGYVTLTHGLNGDARWHVLSKSWEEGGAGTTPIGYTSGGTVTQSTDKATGVLLDALSGEITLNNAALAAGAQVGFVLSNTYIEEGDLLILNQVGGATHSAYVYNAICSAGQAIITLRNITAGSLGEAAELRFAVIKGATS